MDMIVDNTLRTKRIITFLAAIIMPAMIFLSPVPVLASDSIADDIRFEGLQSITEEEAVYLL